MKTFGLPALAAHHGSRDSISTHLRVIPAKTSPKGAVSRNGQAEIQGLASSGGAVSAILVIPAKAGIQGLGCEERRWTPAFAHCCPGYFLPRNESPGAACLGHALQVERLDAGPIPRHSRASGSPGTLVRRTALDPRVREGDGAFFERWWIQRIYSGQQCAFAGVTEHFLSCGEFGKFIRDSSARSRGLRGRWSRSSLATRDPWGAAEAGGVAQVAGAWRLSVLSWKTSSVVR